MVRIVHVEMRRRARRAMNVVRLRDGRGKGRDREFSLDFEVRRVSEKGENLWGEEMGDLCFLEGRR